MSAKNPKSPSQNRHSQVLRPRKAESPRGPETGPAPQPQHASSYAKKKLVRRRLSDLKPHPLQAEFFADLSTQDLTRLQESLSSNGQIEPVEILPDGTIISGHQRVQAATRLGWTEITCWVRDDLVAQGDEAVERRFIESNFNRRQLTPLEQARCYRKLKQMQKTKYGQPNVSGELRDYLAKQFDMSGRNMDRWEKLLNAPREVQDAVGQKKLKLVDGGRVASLRPEQQAEIASRIQAGEAPAAVVAEFFPRKSAGPSPDAALWRLIRCLHETIPAVNPRGRKPRLAIGPEDAVVVRKAVRVLAQILKETAKAGRAQKKAIADVLRMKNHGI